MANKHALSDIQEKFNALAIEKREHFLFTVNALMKCYLDEKDRALLLVTSTDKNRKDGMNLIAINANQDEAEELIDTLCVFRKLDLQEAGYLAN